jgi:hypothetical protein
MKITLTESEFVNRFLAIRGNFSREALAALFAHLEELERDLGEDVEFDPVGICCDWTEYASALEAVEPYGIKPSEPRDVETADRNEEAALAALCDQTTVLELGSGGVVVLNF